MHHAPERGEAIMTVSEINISYTATKAPRVAFSRKRTVATRGKTARSARVAKARRAPASRKKAPSFATKVKKVIMATAKHKQTAPISLYSTVVGGRTCLGYTFNPFLTNRSGLWLPLICRSEQFPARGIDRSEYVGKQFLCQSFHFTLLISPSGARLYPYSQSANSAGFVKMTESVVGRMDGDIGRVIWTKKVLCFKDTLDLGQFGGNRITWENIGGEGNLRRLQIPLPK
ncbi:hypothetical protein T492DRAFT_848245 [Pavlovales sp. CCMP2436]|nr:hypothetical protein T492DRAFT_848245 [Pavlovales sp. CCMP2436]